MRRRRRRGESEREGGERERRESFVQGFFFVPTPRIFLFKGARGKRERKIKGLFGVTEACRGR